MTLMSKRIKLKCPKCGYEFYETVNTITEPRDVFDYEPVVINVPCPKCGTLIKVTSWRPRSVLYEEI